MAIIAAFWCATNTTVYPTEFFGDPVELKFVLAPGWYDAAPIDGAPLGHSSRAWLCNFHYIIGFFNIQGHLFHALRAAGFDFKRITNAVSNLDSISVNQLSD